MDQSAPTQNRRFGRSNVMLQATLELPGGSLPVVLRNLCQEGALIQGKDIPEAGTRVLFHRQGLSVPSRVAWSDTSHAGLEFEYPLFPGELLRHVPPNDRKTSPAANKRPGFAAKPLSPGERVMIERWATEGVNTLGE